MTTTTRHTVACPCGHKGTIRMRENDAPFTRQWESYSLEGLNGGSTEVDGFLSWEEVFARIAPSCPKCGQKLTPDHLTGD
ncbi:hypothetical protein SAMN05878503_12216 [Cereibacter ovatus]|uniref:Uncharacterized protein n=1 Tax=Cereibacter ovatus TaxID=439529 RepID=A0A285D4X8_9RHOB|nr:hypothetical protein SAMN05878503_12216 [Cereibacter ovatus]